MAPPQDDRTLLLSTLVLWSVPCRKNVCTYTVWGSDSASIQCMNDDSVQVMAQLTGAPDRADWKKCMISPDEEAARTESFKAHFKPYDIMQ